MAELPAGYDPYGPTAEGLLDKRGTPFNPSIHQVLKTGRAFLTRAGEWVKKGGRPKASETPVSAGEKAPAKAPETGAKAFNPAAHFTERKPVAVAPEKAAETPAETLPKKPVAGASLPTEAGDPVTASAAPGGMSAVPANASVEDAKLEASSRAAVLASEGLLCLVFGPSQAHSKDEREARLNEWRLFLEGTPGFQLPPWMTLALGYTMQVSSRADKPDFQKRCAMWAGKFKKWFGKG